MKFVHVVGDNIVDERREKRESDGRISVGRFTSIPFSERD